MTRRLREATAWRVRIGVLTAACAVAIVMPAARGAGDGQATGSVTARDLYQQARHQEDAVGNLEAALALYRQVLSAAPDRALAADAQLRVGLCLQTLGRAGAREAFAAVVRDYPEQTAAVTEARVRLTALGTTGPARTGLVQTAPVSAKLWEMPLGGEAIGNVSDDGRLLAYRRWRQGSRGAGLVVRDLAGGMERTLASSDTRAFPASAAFAPDRRSLAVVWSANGFTEVTLTGIGPTELSAGRQIYANEDIIELEVADWSPDGRRLAVHLQRRDRTSQIAVVDVDDGQLHVLRSIEWRRPTGMAFSADGRWLAFDLPASEQTGQRDVFALAVDGSALVPVVAFPNHETFVGWASDGRLLFVSDRSGSQGLWTVPWRDGGVAGEAVMLSDSLSGVARGVTVDGTVVLERRAPAFHGTAFDVRVGTYDFAADRFVDPPATAVHEFVGANESPDWSGDGRQMAYISDRPGGDVIVIQDRETGKVLSVVRPAMTLYPASIRWSPDGRRFVAGGTDVKGRQGLHLIDATSGAVSPLTLTERPDELKRAPAWSADGSKVYYQHRAEGGGASASALNGTRDAVIEVDMASGHERTVIRRGALWDFWLAPDGQSLVVRTWDGSPSRIPVLLLVPVAGGPVTELRRAAPDGGIGVWSWAPDSRSVYVQTDERSIVRVPVDAREPAVAINLGLDASFSAPRLSPDGRHLTFLVRQPDRPSEVWTLRSVLPR